jgi:hypothetical protein
MILIVNIDYFLEQGQQIDVCNGEVFSFRHGLKSNIIKPTAHTLGKPRGSLYSFVCRTAG